MLPGPRAFGMQAKSGDGGQRTSISVLATKACDPGCITHLILVCKMNLESYILSSTNFLRLTNEEGKKITVHY